MAVQTVKPRAKTEYAALYTMIPAAMRERAKRRAKHRGLSMSAYVADLIRADLTPKKQERNTDGN